MSTKEMLYNIIENMTEEQMQAWLVVLGGTASQSSNDDVDALCGILHDAADPNLVQSEKSAWERAAVEKHTKIISEADNENT